MSARFGFTTFGFVLFVISFAVVTAQQPEPGRDTLVVKPRTLLIDQFGILNSEERSARFDLLFSEIGNKPGSTAYIVLFCGKKCQYGEIEAHVRGIEIKIALRRFNRSKLAIVNGGYRDKFDTELWLVENGAAPPDVKPTVNIKYVTFSGTTRKTFEYYDCCDDYREFWRNLKP